MYTLRTNLPLKYKSVKYVRNHHFIELTDDEGETIKLVESSMIRCECYTCKLVLYCEENRISHCWICGGKMKLGWGKLEEKLCFIPESKDG